MLLYLKNKLLALRLTKNGSLLLAAILFILGHRLLLAAFLPFSGDEAYHWEWSRHLALSYYDHPPMTAWLIRAATLVSGNSIFAVRSTAFLCYLGALLFVFLLAHSIGGNRAGLLAIFLFIAIPACAVFGVMITTDPPLLLFWTAGLYFIYLSIFVNEKFWLPAGFAVGGALLCKFLAIHLILSLALFLLISKKRSGVFRSGYFYFFLLAITVTFLPVIYWNYHHEWATFYFNFLKRHTLGFRPIFFLDYLLLQFLLGGVTTSIFFAVAVFSNLRDLRFLKDPGILFLFCFSFVILIFFTCVSFSRRVGAHWPMSGYPSLIVLSSLYGAQLTRTRFLKFAIIFPIILIFLVSTPLLFSHLIPQNLSYGLQKKATTKRLIHFFGWREAASTLNRYLDEMPAKSHIIGESYGVASLMAIYSRRGVPSHVLNLYGIHGLNFYFWDTFNRTKGINGVYVTATDKEKNPVLTPDERKHLKRAFRSFELQPPLKIILGGKHVRTFLFVKCFDLVAPLTLSNPI